jgi:muramoyltetrapeptide carboxypeptidase
MPASGSLNPWNFIWSVPDVDFKSGISGWFGQQRADQLHQFFADSGIDGIICARGGYGAMRILPLLDADAIARNPKVFVGFSDITVLLDFLVERCQMVAFHGPTVTTLGNGDPFTRERFLFALTRPAPLSLTASSTHVIHPGHASGQFLLW